MEKKIKILTVDSKTQFNLQKPRFNPYACGTGVQGDKKFNRKKQKEQDRKLIDGFQ